MEEHKEDLGQTSVPAVFAVLAALVIVGGAFYFSSASSKDSEPKKVADTALQQPAITNPDYVKNPSGYLVDRDNTVLSSLPEGKALWVEQVIDANTIQVSYAVLKAGTSVIDTQTIWVPGLGRLHGCMEQQAETFLRNNLLHKEVYLVREEFTGADLNFMRSVGTSAIKGWRMLIANADGEGTTDVAALVIWNGYGISAAINPAGSLGSKPYPEKYPILFSDIHDMQEVASLAKRGMWATCEV